jgi:hypothetical protein
VRARVAIAAGLASVAALAACNLLNGSGDLEVGPSASDASTVGLDAATSDGTIATGADAALDAAPGVFRGTGRSGALVLDGGTVIVNAYTSVVASAVTGATSVDVADSSAFQVGDLVLLWQAVGLTGAVSGDQGALSLAAGSVGHHETARVASVTPGHVVFETPLAQAYPASVSQIVRVPEYTDVTIPATSQIAAAPWDGKQGGIVAIFATGTVQADGKISTDGMGLRSGAGSQGPGLNGCAALDGAEGQGYAAKGEGIAGGYTPDGGGVGGRGNAANGGGGGNCHNGAGAGGGHGGRGGAGAAGNQGLGGLGGVELVYTPFDALLMGGGGGAGDDNNGAPLPSGGAGGGVVYVTARAIQGSGGISSRGSNGLPAPANDGAGGGGAGGAIVLSSLETLAGVRLRVEGGSGGSSPNGGAGGGGAGGVLALSKTAPAAAVDGGAPGTGVGNNAGEPGAPGRIDVR